MNTLFSLSGLLVMPVWALMILLPGWRWTHRILRSPWSVAPAAALYAVLVLPVVGRIWPVVSRPELAGVAALLGTPSGATIAWVHFLAFDLFVGRWAYLDGRERGVSPWVTAPVLFVMLMLGPLGLLLYLCVRGLRVPGGASAVDPRLERVREGARSVLRLVRSASAVNRPLALVGMLMIPLGAVALLAVALDPRLVGGAPAWVKPVKFAASISVYSLTLLWMLSKVEGHPRAIRAAGTLTAVAFAVEWAVIALQAFRGTASHFNVATGLDAALYGAMGVFVMVLWGMNLVAAVLLLRQRFTDRALAWSLRLGLLASLIGGLVAVPMTIPSTAQRAAVRAGEGTRIGAHAVGVEDGGAGLPVVGWSTEGGDLRVPHFFGLHGLQALPLLGLLLGRARRLGAGHRLALVWTGGAAYLGLVGILYWQALRGESVAAPGPATLSALGLLAAAALAASAGVLLDGYRRRQAWHEPQLTRVG